jgi:ATP-binding cassette, subfamily C (CFTR/MRP), member 1
MNIEPEEDYKEYCSNWNNEEEGSKNAFERGTVEFNRMSAKYRKDLPDVLQEITCRIQAGEKVGIVGRTGAGKSTIINTLLKITDVSSGSIKIDGIDLNKYLIKDLRSSITMIDQEPTLLKSTFKENLDITNQYSN